MCRFRRIELFLRATETLYLVKWLERVSGRDKNKLTRWLESDRGVSVLVPRTQMKGTGRLPGQVLLLQGTFTHPIFPPIIIIFCIVPVPWANLCWNVLRWANHVRP